MSFVKTVMMVLTGEKVIIVIVEVKYDNKNKYPKL